MIYSTEYVARLEAENKALRYILEANGFAVRDGDFIRADGTRTTVAAQPVDPEKLLSATQRAFRHRESVTRDTVGRSLVREARGTTDA